MFGLSLATFASSDGSSGTKKKKGKKIHFEGCNFFQSFSDHLDWLLTVSISYFASAVVMPVLIGLTIRAHEKKKKSIPVIPHELMFHESTTDEHENDEREENSELPSIFAIDLDDHANAEEDADPENEYVEINFDHQGENGHKIVFVKSVQIY